jgi:hydroxypyruvate reductase
VRKHLSQLKGGGLAKLAYPADVHALILSDVLGDELSSIASGTTVADNSSFSDAICVLKTKGLWHNVPLSVRSYLLGGEQGLVAETPKESDPVFTNTGYHLIGSNTLSVNAMRDAAELAGFEVAVVDYSLCGEAKQAAETLVTLAKTRRERGINKPLALLAGGETTVTLTGTGLGGRNQEMSLAFAIAAQKQGLTGDWLFLSGGTDGRDGPTDAAGGIIDNNSLSLINNAEQLLLNNDSYNALKQANALLITGATGTNVADLQILLLLPN